MINVLQFSQLNWICWFNIPSKGPSMIADIPPLKFEVWGITRLLRNINAKKAYGPDNISLAGFWIASHAGVFRDFCRSYVCLNEFGSTKTKAKLFTRRTKLSDLNPLNVYCDMTTDGGEFCSKKNLKLWAIVAHSNYFSVSDWTIFPGFFFINIYHYQI